MALSLLLSIYLLLDASGSFYLAYTMYPNYGWGWMTVNGIASLVLAIFLLLGWPKTTPVVLGFFIGISLVFDGWVLMMIWWRSRHLELLR